MPREMILHSLLLNILATDPKVGRLGKTPSKTSLEEISSPCSSLSESTLAHALKVPSLWGTVEYVLFLRVLYPSLGLQLLKSFIIIALSLSLYFFSFHSPLSYVQNMFLCFTICLLHKCFLGKDTESGKSGRR